MYNEIIYFATSQKTGETDEFGDEVSETVTTEVYAEVKSIGQKEFYEAQTAGYKPEIKFKIPDYLDYAGQEYVIYGGILYKVLRTYKTKDNELEITCYGGVRDVIATVSDEDI